MTFLPAIVDSTYVASTLLQRLIRKQLGTERPHNLEHHITQVASCTLYIEDLAFSPREVIAAMVDRGCPTTLYQDVTDSATGKTIQVPVRDGEGNLVESKVALQMKQALIEGLFALVSREPA